MVEQLKDGRRALPVVGVNDVDRSTLGAHCLQGGASEQREAPAIIRIVGPTLAVVAGPVEALRTLDEPQAIPVRLRGDDRDLDLAEWRGHVQVEPFRLTRGVDAAVARQVDVDLVSSLTESARQRVDDVRQPARLGKGLAFGGDHGDSHEAPILAGTVR